MASTTITVFTRTTPTHATITTKSAQEDNLVFIRLTEFKSGDLDRGCEHTDSSMESDWYVAAAPIEWELLNLSPVLN